MEKSMVHTGLVKTRISRYGVVNICLVGKYFSYTLRGFISYVDRKLSRYTFQSILCALKSERFNIMKQKYRKLYVFKKKTMVKL